MTEQKKKQRWHLLDTLRGLTLISMIIFHLLYDFYVVYGIEPDWPLRDAIVIWQQSICWTFIIISGMALHFSRNPWKRGGIVIFFGFLITVVTMVVMPEETIWFGILNCIGLAMIVTAAVQPVLNKIAPIYGIFLSVAGFGLTQQVSEGYLGCYSWKILKLPEQLYQWFPGAWLGFPKKDFWSSDYFPMFPWIFVFWSGYYLCAFIKKNTRLTKIMTMGRTPVLSFVGQKTLWFYILHQPVCMLACMVYFSVI